MAEESIELRYFEHLVEYAVAVGKECRHGILPSYLESYLQRN
jgi:hypothetical protein